MASQSSRGSSRRLVVLASPGSALPAELARALERSGVAFALVDDVEAARREYAARGFEVVVWEAAAAGASGAERLGVRAVAESEPAWAPASAQGAVRRGPRAGEEVTATVAKTEFGRLLGRVVSGEAVVITRHERPAAVLVPYEAYRELTEDTRPELEALRHEFDDLLARMQSPEARAATDALFSASPAELGEAAVADAREEGGPAERGGD